MNRYRPFIIGAIGGALGIIFLPLTGVLNRSAEPGQWWGADWFDYMSARQSVTLRSMRVEVPPLDDPARIARGAGHYEMVCAACHGSPTHLPEQMARNLAPPPPPLMEQMRQWRPEARIVWTVKHGIRHTAMPGWPSQVRDDEVWDMVAFLLAMPGMDAEAYGALASGTADNDCARCHGENGEGALAGVPRLDIQSPAYLETAITAFRDGTRQSGTMIAAARTLGDAEIAELAEQFGQGVRMQTGAETTGAAIARHGIPDRDVPACDSCHGPAGRPDYPRLAGQDAGYLLRQLQLFAELGENRGGPRAHIMAEVVKGLDPEEMEALAAYYGGEPDHPGE